MPASPHRILLIKTGGTIVGHVAAEKGHADVRLRTKDFYEAAKRISSYIGRISDTDIDIEPHELCDVDSSNICPRDWENLCALIKQRYDRYQSFVVTHGTSTLAYTCAAVSFALPNPAKPIVFTGSQISAGLPGSDAQANLANAIRVATWKHSGPRSRSTFPGVVAVFGSYIIAGTRLKKVAEFDYDAFKPFNSTELGRISRYIVPHEDNLRRHAGYHETKSYGPADTGKDLICDNTFDMQIASLTEFPGMASSFFRTLVDRNNVQGFILRTFGAGDPCERHLDAFKFLKRKRIPIVMTTQVPNGLADFRANGPGSRIEKDELAIPAYDMSIETITTKLGWLLAKKTRKQITYEQLCREMVRDMRGEINESLRHRV